jgi:hypothetical protein
MQRNKEVRQQQNERCLHPVAFLVALPLRTSKHHWSPRSVTRQREFNWMGKRWALVSEDFGFPLGL